MPEPTRTLLVDDSDVYRESLAALLVQTPSIQIVGHAATAAEAIRLADDLRPGLVLVDVVLPDQSGFEVTRRLKAGAEPPVVIVLTLHALQRYREAALAAGADDFLLKDQVPAALIPAICRLVTC